MNIKFKAVTLTVLMSSAFYTAAEASVPSDAKKYNHHYYKVYNRSMNWRQARDYCEDLGGHLATITSYSEQEFVTELISEYGNKNCYWLGGYKDSRGGWRWVTNESMSYSNWGPRQPDNFKGVEDSLMIYRRRNPASQDNRRGQWNDICWDGECDGQSFFGTRNFGFVCEWDSSGSSRRDRYNDDYYDDYYDDDYDDDYDDWNHNKRRRNRWNY